MTIPTGNTSLTHFLITTTACIDITNQVTARLLLARRWGWKRWRRHMELNNSQSLSASRILYRYPPIKTATRIIVSTVAPASVDIPSSRRAIIPPGRNVLVDICVDFFAKLLRGMTRISTACGECASAAGFGLLLVGVLLMYKIVCVSPWISLFIIMARDFIIQLCLAAVLRYTRLCDYPWCTKLTSVVDYCIVACSLTIVE